MKYKMKTRQRGQACQDLFAYSIGGDNATYIEIGAYKPKNKNNTYTLEVDYNWKGFSLELNTDLKSHWDECIERKNPIIWENAITFDYLKQIKNQNLPNKITYLSCDIEPPVNTFLALQRVIEQGIEFDCITFEHDNYANPGGPDYNVIATEYLYSKGYKIAVTDVYAGKDQNAIFETWFVKNNIEFPTLTYTQWRKLVGIDQ